MGFRLGLGACIIYLSNEAFYLSSVVDKHLSRTFTNASSECF